MSSIRVAEANYAAHVYKFLETQLDAMSQYKKYVNKENVMYNAFVHDVIGMIELKMALARAIVCNADQQEEVYDD